MIFVVCILEKGVYSVSVNSGGYMPRTANSRKTTNKRGPATKPLVGQGKSGLSTADIYGLIQKRAYEIYCNRRNEPGDQVNDWLVAEKQVRTELRTQR